LRPQVLRQLVDELLQLQEAQKSKIQITSEDLDKSLKRIAQQNNISVEQIYKTLDDAKISRSTLQTQLKADLAWQKLIQHDLNLFSFRVVGLSAITHIQEFRQSGVTVVGVQYKFLQGVVLRSLSPLLKSITLNLE
jgi:hypothetical protein